MRAGASSADELLNVLEKVAEQAERAAAIIRSSSSASCSSVGSVGIEVTFVVMEDQSGHFHSLVSTVHSADYDTENRIILSPRASLSKISGRGANSNRRPKTGSLHDRVISI